jgi:hypothetical protein
MGKRIDGARKLRRGLFYLRLEAFKSLEEFGERAVREWPGWALGLGLGLRAGGGHHAILRGRCSFTRFVVVGIGDPGAVCALRGRGVW